VTAVDVVVAYNSPRDVGDLPGAVRETARVLRARNRLGLCATRPVRDAGRFPGGERG
jgi:hypothetical protein